MEVNWLQRRWLRHPVRDERIVVPEILDELSAGDPRAVLSRHELVWINSLMGNWRWLRSALGRHHQVGETVAELGAGDGILATDFLTGLLGDDGNPLTYVGYDLAPRPRNWPAGWEWNRGDLRAAPAKSEIVLVNLFLHHFDDEALRELLAPTIDQARVLLFSEPARYGVHQWMGRCLYPFGLSEVTRHDMQVSIAAGFREGELADILGLDSRSWAVREQRSFMGALRFEAVRK